MFCKEKTFRQENHNNKPRKTHRNIPSFSSTLLDEICRSIDGSGDGPEDFPASGSGAKNGGSMRERGEESVARFSRACLVEKWMEKQVDEKNEARKLKKSIFPDNDSLFVSSSSSSSDSSGALSSSDTEVFGSTKVSRAATRPKPVRTGVSPRDYNDEGAECLMYNNYLNIDKNRVEDDLIKSKSRAIKIYANLKRLKQPISPGGKLTSLINSLFTSTNRRKSKDEKRNQTAPSSASSFSRSCLSKCTPKSSERERNGVQRSVRFHPVGVIVDQDSKPCGKKCIYNEGCDRYSGRPPLPPNALAELKMREKNRKVEDRRKFDLSMFSKIKNDGDDDDDDDDDAFSESSSDLFELDHLSLLENNDRFCEELPVYETTYFDKNRCLIR